MDDDKTTATTTVEPTVVEQEAQQQAQQDAQAQQDMAHFQQWQTSQHDAAGAANLTYEEYYRLYYSSGAATEAAMAKARFDKNGNYIPTDEELHMTQLMQQQAWMSYLEYSKSMIKNPFEAAQNGDNKSGKDDKKRAGSGKKKILDPKNLLAKKSLSSQCLTSQTQIQTQTENSPVTENALKISLKMGGVNSANPMISEKAKQQLSSPAVGQIGQMRRRSVGPELDPDLAQYDAEIVSVQNAYAAYVTEQHQLMEETFQRFEDGKRDFEKQIDTLRSEKEAERERKLRKMEEEEAARKLKEEEEIRKQKEAEEVAKRQKEEEAERFRRDEEDRERRRQQYEEELREIQRMEQERERSVRSLRHRIREEEASERDLGAMVNPYGSLPSADETAESYNDVSQAKKVSTSSKHISSIFDLDEGEDGKRTIAQPRSRYRQDEQLDVGDRRHPHSPAHDDYSRGYRTSDHHGGMDVDYRQSEKHSSGRRGEPRDFPEAKYHQHDGHQYSENYNERRHAVHGRQERHSRTQYNYPQEYPNRELDREGDRYDHQRKHPEDDYRRRNRELRGHNEIETFPHPGREEMQERSDAENGDDRKRSRRSDNLRSKSRRDRRHNSKQHEASESDSDEEIEDRRRRKKASRRRSEDNGKSSRSNRSRHHGRESKRKRREYQSEEETGEPHEDADGDGENHVVSSKKVDQGVADIVVSEVNGSAEVEDVDASRDRDGNARRRHKVSSRHTSRHRSSRSHRKKHKSRHSSKRRRRRTREPESSDQSDDTTDESDSGSDSGSAEDSSESVSASSSGSGEESDEESRREKERRRRKELRHVEKEKAEKQRSRISESNRSRLD